MARQQSGGVRPLTPGDCYKGAHQPLPRKWYSFRVSFAMADTWVPLPSGPQTLHIPLKLWAKKRQSHSEGCPLWGPKERSPSLDHGRSPRVFRESDLVSIESHTLFSYDIINLQGNVWETILTEPIGEWVTRVSIYLL